MKFISVFALFGFLAKITMADEFFDADISFDCKGVDLESLTPEETEYAGQALLATYNQLHEIYGHGKKEMFDIMFDSELKQWAPGVSCTPYCTENNCVDDYYFWWMFDDPSVFCSNNRRALVVEHGSGKRKVDKYWDRDFTAMLRQGPFEAFKNAKSCDIEMGWTLVEKPTHGSPTDKDLGFGASKYANVKLTCDEGNLFALSDEEYAYLAHLLLVAYADTHSEDTFLFNLKMLESSDNASSWSGIWGCHSCNQPGSKLRGGADKAWVDAFVAGLTKAPYTDLKNLDKCSISYTLDDHVEDIDSTKSA